MFLAKMHQIHLSAGPRPYQRCPNPLSSTLPQAGTVPYTKLSLVAVGVQLRRAKTLCVV